MKRSFRWHLRDRIYRNLTALRISLTVAVHHLERDFLDVQREKGACSIPCRDCWCLILCPVRLRQHEPISTEHEALERDFHFGLAAVFAFLFDRALARHGHT